MTQAACLVLVSQAESSPGQTVRSSGRAQATFRNFRAFAAWALPRSGEITLQCGGPGWLAALSDFDSWMEAQIERTSSVVSCRPSRHVMPCAGSRAPVSRCIQFPVFGACSLQLRGLGPRAVAPGSDVGTRRLGETRPGPGSVCVLDSFAGLDLDVLNAALSGCESMWQQALVGSV